MNSQFAILRWKRNLSAQWCKVNKRLTPLGRLRRSGSEQGRAGPIMSLASLGLAFFCTACATTTLRPAPEAQVVPGPGTGAVAADEGVQLEARTGAWNGFPNNLAYEVTPVLVTITNESEIPLRIRYDEFQLVSPSGKTFAALPPFDMVRTVTDQIGFVEYPLWGFSIAPHLSPYYPWLTPFDGPFAYDPFYYQRYYPVFARIQLPTADMLQKALPEGVLEPQGRLSGFLYFEPVGDEVTRVDFKAELPNARATEQVAAVSIPFILS